MKLLLALVFMLSACSYHKDAEKRVADSLDAQAPVPSADALAEKSKEVIAEAETLTPQQKARMDELANNLRLRNNAMQQEIRRRELVLLKKLVEPKTNESEINILKNDILSLNKDRTDLWLETIQQAQQVLGKRQNNPSYYSRLRLENLANEPSGRLEGPEGPEGKQ